MATQWAFDDTYTRDSGRQNVSKNEFQERDRRQNAMEVVSIYRSSLESMFTPLVGKEYLSLLFRQRGVPSVDMFTRIRV